MPKIVCRSLGLLTALILILGTAGCSGRPIETSGGQQRDEASSNWESQLREESLSGSTDLEKALCSSVSLKVDRVGTDTLEITVSAPNISAGLTQWMDQIPEEDFTEAALNGQILHLLDVTAPTSTKVSLPYTIGDDGARQIVYTDAYIQLISCGLKEFYDNMMAHGAEQLEGGES